MVTIASDAPAILIHGGIFFIAVMPVYSRGLDRANFNTNLAFLAFICPNIWFWDEQVINQLHSAPSGFQASDLALIYTIGTLTSDHICFRSVF